MTVIASTGPRYEILGSPTDGTHAELVAVPAENVFPKPTRLTREEAAALPLAGVTAWRALVTRGRLTAGETVVVTAASSGVGAFAIQMAAALGARVVAVTSSKEKLVVAEELGADRVVLRNGADFGRDLRDAVAEDADLVVDPTGAGWQLLLEALKPGGRFVSLGRIAAHQATVAVHTVFWKQVDLLGSSMGSPTDFAALLAHVEGAGLSPVIDSVFPLTRIHDAYMRLDSTDRIGKVVLALE